MAQTVGSPWCMEDTEAMRSSMINERAQPILAAWCQSSPEDGKVRTPKPTRPLEPMQPTELVQKLFHTPPAKRHVENSSGVKRARDDVQKRGSFKRNKQCRGGARKPPLGGARKRPLDVTPLAEPVDSPAPVDAPAPVESSEFVSMKDFPDNESAVAYLAKLGVPQELLPDPERWDNRGAYSYTKKHPNGASVEILIRTRCFFKKAMKGGVPPSLPRTIGWEKHSGIAAAWQTAQVDLGWD